MKSGVTPFVSHPPVGNNFPYYSWTFLPNTHLVDLIQRCHNRNDDVRVVAVTEPASHYNSLFPLSIEDTEEWKQINVDVIYGSSNKYDYEKKFYENRDGFRFFSPNRHFFPIYFLYHTFADYSGRYNTPPDIEYKPVKHFTCYNYRSRPHRVILLSFLKERGLLDNNFYSFVENDLNWEVIKNLYNFNFKDVNLEVNLLEDIDEINHNYYTYHDAFTTTSFQLVTETTDDHIFLTEKTFFPILAKKPFVTFGAPYTNEILKDFGFRLYDSVFDYNFDKIMDTVERAQALTDEVDRVTKKFTPLEIYEKLKPTSDYNYNVAIDILKNEKFIPEIYRKWDAEFGNSSIWADHVAAYYRSHKKHLSSY